MIEVKKVYKTFQNATVLSNIDLQIEKGTIFGLLGSNGAGKTTLLKLIAGLYKQDRGDILIDKKPVFENEDIKQRFIFLTDIPYFFPHYTIKQMANFYENIYPSFSRERFQTLQDVFDLDLKQKIYRLSKGVQRQVAFWLAFSAMPELLILDEPFDGLDPVMRKKMKNIIIQDVAAREMTVIVSSHNLQEVEDISDHIGILHKGELLIKRNLDDLKSNIHKVQIAFQGSVPSEMLQQLQIVYQEQRGSVHLFIVKGNADEFSSYIKSFKPLLFDLLPLTLEEIFIYEMGEKGYAIENILI
ncbi:MULTISPECIES: ABC transporter ATP-binding protein [Aeribacillus]|uniref:ABC transporter n=1 Tax=Aeribacillus pallidus TaxID=33936 RepID=A0A223E6B0_9BACI|nr:ATP-binding cassette domain-containing protein [Aeribacillus pallidus]ASS90730.1 ABC transporter [Aeribacillus pallidus]